MNKQHGTQAIHGKSNTDIPYWLEQQEETKQNKTKPPQKNKKEKT